MPFEVFRRHQKKLLAVFAILAMFGFVLSDTLSRWSSASRGAVTNPVVVELYGKPVRRSDLGSIAERRYKANRFLYPMVGPDFFGGVQTRDLVDAFILDHEADRLGIPNDVELAKEWLTQQTRGAMNQARFDMLLAQMGGDAYAEDILSCLAGQIRIMEVRRLLGNPLISPLDIFETYRDQNERGTYKLVSFPVANFTDKVGEPTEADLLALFESYKNVLPDPAKETPGFKIPQQVKVEILTADVAAVAKQLETKLTETELRAYYENHKAELTPPKELPTDLFAHDPEAKLTPPIYRPFDQLKDTLVGMLARERAQEEVTAKFDKIKDEVVNKFADDYHTTLAEMEDARKAGEPVTKSLPNMVELSAVAKANGLTYEMTPLLTREEAANYGQISGANAGAALSIDDPKFADVLFDEKNPVYDSLEFVDVAGRRYLARKVLDSPPHAGTLDEVRPKVIAAWKIGKARELAQKAASEALAKIKADGGTIKDQVVMGRPVFQLEGVTRRRPGMPIPGGFLQSATSTPSEFAQIPFAGDDFRSALFGLKAGEAATASNSPRDTFYVMTLAKRDPVGFQSLYGPTTFPTPYMEESAREAVEAKQTRWMRHLRDQAGLPEGWTPPGETERAARKA